MSDLNQIFDYQNGYLDGQSSVIDIIDDWVESGEPFDVLLNRIEELRKGIESA